MKLPRRPQLRQVDLPVHFANPDNCCGDTGAVGHRCATRLEDRHQAGRPYRVTQPEMIAAGFDISGDAANLRLYVDGSEVPIELSRNSGPLGANDFLEFYGTGVDTVTTDTHVYYLVNGTQPGLRCRCLGELHPSAGPTPVSPAPSPSRVASPTLEAPANDSNRGWFSGISSGVVAVKEVRAQQSVAVNLPQPQSIPATQQSEFVPVLRDNRDPGPESRASTLATIESGSMKDAEKTTPALSPLPKPAWSQPPRRIRNKKKHSRRNVRMRRGHAAGRKRNHVSPAVDSSAGFFYDIQLKERFNYFSSLLNGDAGNFFGFSLITPPYTQQNAPTTRTLKVRDLQTDSQGTALLRVGLQGTSLQAHLVEVLVNDVMVGSLSFNLQQFGEQTFSFAVSQLHEGDNVIKFMTSATNDRSLFATPSRVTRASIAPTTTRSRFY